MEQALIPNVRFITGVVFVSFFVVLYVDAKAVAGERGIRGRVNLCQRATPVAVIDPITVRFLRLLSRVILDLTIVKFLLMQINSCQ